jgi:hypothetical protein
MGTGMTFLDFLVGASPHYHAIEWLGTFIRTEFP